MSNTTGPAAVVGGNNTGVVAGIYNAPATVSHAQEELAKEQLSEARQRRVEERAAHSRRLAEEKASQSRRAVEDEQSRVRQRVGQLTQEYILSHDGLSPALLAGLETPPEEWMNTRLVQLGEPYTFFAIGGGRYTMNPRR